MVMNIIKRKPTKYKNEILDKYRVPLLLFFTTGSDERDKLIKKLNNIRK